MFGWRAKRGIGDSARALPVFEGLLPLSKDFALDPKSPDIQSQLPPKIEMLRSVSRALGDSVPPELLFLTEPGSRLDLDGIRNFDQLAPYGQGLALLGVSVGWVRSFLCGHALEAMADATKPGVGVQLRAIAFACAAYERYGDDRLVGHMLDTNMQSLQRDVEKFKLPEPPTAQAREAGEEMESMCRRLDWLFAYHYRPRAMPHLSTITPQDKGTFEFGNAVKRSVIRRS